MYNAYGGNLLNLFDGMSTDILKKTIRKTSEIEDRKHLSSDSPNRVMVNVFSGQRMYTGLNEK